MASGHEAKKCMASQPLGHDPQLVSDHTDAIASYCLCHGMLGGSIPASFGVSSCLQLMASAMATSSSHREDASVRALQKRFHSFVSYNLKETSQASEERRVL